MSARDDHPALPLIMAAQSASMRERMSYETRVKLRRKLAELPKSAALAKLPDWARPALELLEDLTRRVADDPNVPGLRRAMGRQADVVQSGVTYALAGTKRLRLVGVPPAGEQEDLIS